MKTVSILLASASFYLGFGAELLTNGDFEAGTLNGWFTTLMSSSDKISPKTFEWGTDIHFLLDDGGEENWEVSLMQSIAVRKGYRYTITFGGSGIEDDKTVNFGINHNGGTGNGGDGSEDYTTYVADNVTLPETTYTEFSLVWDDTTVNDTHARFFLNGGGNDIDFSIAWVSVWESPIDTMPPAATLRFTRFGFYTNGAKRIVVLGASSDSFQIKNSGGTELLTGKLSSASTWAPSGETVRIADLSSIKTNGVYTVYCGKEPAAGGSVTIAANPLQDLGKAALKAYYYQRASTSLTAAYAGTWARAAGTPDNTVTVHSSAGSGTVSSPKGWYDAGDYGKYIVNCGITMYTLLALYEHFPEYLSNLALTIPESGDAVPDILDEARWNLEWMLTMQTTDGGVYSKLTPLQFDDVVMPEDANTSRYVFMKTTPATLDFAAVMAMSSRIYQPFDGTFAAICLEAAKKAYAWAAANPNVKYVQPADCNTGDYADNNFDDEFYWASVELALATAGSETYTYHTTNPLPSGSVPSWQNVGTLGLYTILTNPQVFPTAVTDGARARIISAADTLLGRQKNGYGISMTTADFYWGSNHVAVSQGILMLYAYYLTKKNEYLGGAEQQIDYILGRNPFGKSFVTGYGDYSPLHPHHRPSEADGIAAPVPGFLVGGSHMGGQDTSYCEKYLDKPATSWLDKFCSSPTNEVAINWNAPLAYCVNALEALNRGDTVAGFVRLSTNTAAENRDVPPRQTMTLSRCGNRYLFRIPASEMPAATGRCRVYNSLGRQIADVPLESAADQFMTASVAAGSMAKGCVFVRMNSGAVTVQRKFMILRHSTGIMEN